MTVRELRDLLRGQEVDVTKAGLTGDEDGLEVFRLTSEQFVR